MQLLELDVPMVLALNMMDEMRGNGGSVRINKLESMLGIPVVPISAAKNEGITELINHAIHVAQYQKAKTDRILRLKTVITEQFIAVFMQSCI